MTVNETDLLQRMREVEPLPARVSAHALDTLAEVMAVSAPSNVVDLARARRSRRRAVVGIAASFAAVAGLALGAVALNAAGDSAGSTHARQTAGPSNISAPATASGQHIQLAGYTFALPTGFKKQSAACTGSTSGDASVSAGSQAGGCVDVSFTSGLAVPSGLSAVTVGPYSGRVVDNSDTVQLYVTIPSSGGHRSLVFVARGLSVEQVTSIARSGLPSSLGPVTACGTNCG